METVMVATDGSATANGAVRRAADIAVAESARLVAVYVVPHDDWRLRRLGPAAEMVATRLVVSEHDRPIRDAQRIAGELGIRVEPVVVADEDTLAGILDVAAEIRPDLLVVGSDGHGGLLGAHRRGLSEAVARKAPCDVLVVVAVRRS